MHKPRVELSRADSFEELLSCVYVAHGLRGPLTADNLTKFADELRRHTREVLPSPDGSAKFSVEGLLAITEDAWIGVQLPLRFKSALWAELCAAKRIRVQGLQVRVHTAPGETSADSHAGDDPPIEMVSDTPATVGETAKTCSSQSETRASADEGAELHSRGGISADSLLAIITIVLGLAACAVRLGLVPLPPEPDPPSC